MATTTMTMATSILFDEPDLCPVLDDAMQASPEAINKLYNTHYRHVLRVCRRFFRRPEDAEDAAAEVFLKLRAVLRQKNASRPFRPWVSQVAGRHCIDKLRKMKRETNSCVDGIEFSELPDHAAQSPLSQVLQNEEQRRLRNLLSNLPRHYRIPLILRYYNQMSYSEIARKLNRGLPAVRCMIFRAKNQLRRELLLDPS
jgi:RNA polymerase sigma-70 factor (ECF subfamily)